MKMPLKQPVSISSLSYKTREIVNGLGEKKGYWINAIKWAYTNGHSSPEFKSQAIPPDTNPSDWQTIEFCDINRISKIQGTAARGGINIR